MLAEIITFAGIVCAGVLTQGEAERELSQWIVGPRFVPGTSRRNCPYQGLGSWAPGAGLTDICISFELGTQSIYLLVLTESAWRHPGGLRTVIHFRSCIS